MTIDIIGWYGTETIGDRAIFDGILSALQEVNKPIEILLGSLYPFFSERTMYEDKLIYTQTAPEINISIYNIKIEAERKNAILKSDLVLVGGGPLMDIKEMRIIYDCFWNAYRHDIPCIVCGCGIGPLNNLEYQKLAQDILNMSAKIAYRDYKSAQYSDKLFGTDFGGTVLGDPAIVSIQNFRKNLKRNNRSNYVAVNFRRTHAEYGNIKSNLSFFKELVEQLAETYDEVKLVPMHTFAIGGDDRLFFSELFMKERENVTIMHSPVNLHEIYTVYANADACIGMRYHSVVMQTILNGNNYILNYTDSKNGKITGFIDFIGATEFYQDRECNLLQEDIVDSRKIVNKLTKCQKYLHKEMDIKQTYIDFFREIFSTL